MTAKECSKYEETPISVWQYRAIADALTDVAIEILDTDYKAVHKASASVAREYALCKRQ